MAWVMPVRAMGKRELGEFIQKRRKELGMTQEDLADLVGRDQHWVSRLERGIVRLPGPEELAQLAQALDVDVAVLLQAAGYLTGDVSPQPRPVPDSPLAIYLRQLDARADLDPETKAQIRALLRLVQRIAGEDS